mmetsp:Transcript_19940/g.41668  ORF Transcript_19940/g.41668 Transcript_19940/m.41668 type:complete len:245 (-) Transcript_19940:953-1687(-)
MTTSVSSSTSRRICSFWTHVGKFTHPPPLTGNDEVRRTVCHSSGSTLQKYWTLKILTKSLCVIQNEEEFAALGLRFAARATSRFSSQRGDEFPQSPVKSPVPHGFPIFTSFNLFSLISKVSRTEYPNPKTIPILLITCTSPSSFVTTVGVVEEQPTTPFFSSFLRASQNFPWLTFSWNLGSLFVSAVVAIPPVKSLRAYSILPSMIDSYPPWIFAYAFSTSMAQISFLSCPWVKRGRPRRLKGK